MIEFNEARVEQIARAYCRLKDMDPDERVSHGAEPGPSGFTPAILLHSPRWKLVAHSVREWMTMDAAMWDAADSAPMEAPK